VLRINGALILEKKMNKISMEKKQAFLFLWNSAQTCTIL